MLGRHAWRSKPSSRTQVRFLGLSRQSSSLEYSSLTYYANLRERETPMAKTRKKLLIVDGYNVLRSGSRYKRISSPDYTDDTFNTARERLINDVINYAGREYKAIIVFDGGRNEFSAGAIEKLGDVQIMFSRAGESADKVIEKLAFDARERMIETLVVTSDATIQDTVFGGGVDRMSADGFSSEVGMYYDEARLDETPKVAKKSTVASRIPADTLAKLKAMRDGNKPR